MLCATVPRVARISVRMAWQLQHPLLRRETSLRKELRKSRTSELNCIDESSAACYSVVNISQMFGALKRLFSKTGKSVSESGNVPVRPSSPRASSTGGVGMQGTPGKVVEPARSSTSTQTSVLQRASTADSPSQSVPAQRTTPVTTVRAFVRLPLEPILARMPTTLTALVRRPETREIAIPLPVITAQLSTGTVRVTFGEFRKFGPDGTFADNPAHDQVVIELPLRDVLARVSPQLLQRRMQRRVVVPESVTSIFEPAAIVGQQSAAVSSRAPAAQPVAGFSGVAADRTPVAPAPAPPPPSAPQESPSLSLVVSTVSAAWPDRVRAEIDQYGLQQAALVMPINRLEPAVKSGRVTFEWAELALWLKPGLPPDVTPDPTAWVDLPLNIVAPLFLSRLGGTVKPRKKAASVENMPDLFTGKADVPSTVLPPAHSMPSNIADLVPQSVPFVPKQAPAPEVKTDSVTEILSGLFKSDWSPFELVNKTACLVGTVGALLATKDGLLVADKLPPHLNPETVSAFLPQMFTRMDHYSTELQLGPLSSLTLMLGAVPCMILDAGALYLIVLGRAGEQLPTLHVHQIAAALAKRTS